jgi:hypothetical protein
MPPTQSKKQPTAVSPDPPVVDASQSKKKKPVSSPAATSASVAPSVAPSVAATTTPSSAAVPSVATASTSVPRVLSVVVPVALHTSTEAVPVALAAPAVLTEPATDNVLSNIIDKVNALSAYIKDIQTNLKVLSKEYDKQQKIIEKAQKKRQNAKNSPSGFAKPNKISDELCDFIGVPHGTEKSRTDITRFINAYVKEHNLNKPENKRFILPDAKLKKILNVGDSDEINYFILQKLISHHFPASASKTAAKTAVAAATTAV